MQDLLAALPRIRRTHPGTTLTIAGSGTQLEWLLELARKHRVVGAVTFRGSVDRAELIELMHRSAAIVLPSRYEPFGIVALEAAATGVPLVVSTAGGPVRPSPTLTPMTFPPADVTALAAAVRTTPTTPRPRHSRCAARLRQVDRGVLLADRRRAHDGGLRRREASGPPPDRAANIVERPLPECDPNQPIT